MELLLRSVRRRFTATILIVVAVVIAVSWTTLQWYSQSALDAPAHIDEVHQTGENNEAFAAYLEEQKAYEAHFISLASDIKKQEAARVTKALALTTIGVTVIGLVIAVVAARRLIRPVEEAYRSQERFLQDAAHELRNPLAAMNAALQQVSPKESRSKLVQTFRRQTKRLIHINEDLLFLEKRASNAIEKIDLSELLQDIVEELQPLAASRRITLSLESDGAITKMMNSNDYVRLMRNIIDNAIKYSKDGGVVRISQREQRNWIEITVADQGIGIPKKELERIGERFFRASNTGQVDGTGLGLAIVAKILNVYGGQREIASSLAKGTTVSVRLPA